MSSPHGHCRDRKMSREYRTWSSMVQRCTNPNLREWKFYGGRGIAVCEAWLDFRQFLLDMGPRPEGMTLDRFPDRDGPYSPDNCRWATQAQQVRNTRRNIFATIDGRTQCLKDWCVELGKNYRTVVQRVSVGVSPEDALKLPLQTGWNRPMTGD